MTIGAGITHNVILSGVRSDRRRTERKNLRERSLTSFGGFLRFGAYAPSVEMTYGVVESCFAHLLSVALLRDFSALVEMTKGVRSK